MHIIIIDDDTLVCSALKTIITSKQITVDGVGHNYEDAISLYQTYQPDIVLMDIRMGEKTGLDAASTILQQNKQAKILFLTTFADDEYIRKAIQIGAKGYILKQDFENIVPALQAVSLEQSVFGKEIIDKIPSILSHPESNPFHHELLDQKELNIIELVAQGLSNKEIAQKLFFSEGTVRNYLSTITEKLGLKSRTQLVVFYYKNMQ